ncbi:MAG: HAD family phosphatase [Anaerolineales bacterium]|jgi:HAD superfamily hydrolase (TIGR01549 family)
MIQAMVFDLDGTLVQTEKLKARSYARAAVELCPREMQEEEVVRAFGEVVGLPRREVAESLMKRFDLEEKSRARMTEFGVSVPWQAFAQVRLAIYQSMLADPEVIRGNQWPHNMALLSQAQQTGCRTALATMSTCRQASRVLDILGLAEAFDFVATRDDVERGKPDPEIYHLVANELNVAPEHCLVIEDSPSGVQAAVAAGMHCIAVTTPFTKKGVHALGLLDERWIVDEADRLLQVVGQMMQLAGEG